jgi:predicted Zn-dependent protease
LEDVIVGNKDIIEASLKFYFDDKFSVEYMSFEGLDKYIPTGRRQIDAKKFILDPPVEISRNPPKINIFLVDRDVFVPGFNYVFAVTNPPLSRILISLFRLSREYSLKNLVDRSRLRERLFKELMHELGHLIGLEHCENKLCVMSFSRNLKELDEKIGWPCEDCIEKMSGLIDRIRELDP